MRPVTTLSRRTRLRWALALGLAFCSGPALAAHWSDQLSAESRRAYVAGTTLFRDGDFAGAAHKFQEAYTRDGDPRLLWNLIVAKKSERDYAAVAKLTDKYLKQHRTQLSAADRTQAQRLLDAVQQFVVYLQPVLNVDDAELLVDGKLVGSSPFFDPVVLNMGEHLLRVTKPNHSEWTTREDWAGGEHVTVDIVLQPTVAQGTLVVQTDPKVAILIDGALRGTGQFRGVLDVGEHQLQLSAPGADGYDSPLAIEAGETTMVRLSLDGFSGHAPIGALSPMADSSTSDTPLWPWLAGGAGLVALGTAAFFLRSQTPDRLAPISGTAEPGVITVP